MISVKNVIKNLIFQALQQVFQLIRQVQHHKLPAQQKHLPKQMQITIRKVQQNPVVFQAIGVK